MLAVYYGAVEENQAADFNIRFFGAAALGIAVISFFARNAPQDSEALRADLYGDFVASGAVAIVALLVQLSELAAPLLWFNVALNVIFTLAFGYFAIVKRPSST